jgi:hypothetical protein
LYPGIKNIHKKKTNCAIFMKQWDKNFGYFWFSDVTEFTVLKITTYIWVPVLCLISDSDALTAECQCDKYDCSVTQYCYDSSCHDSPKPAAAVGNDSFIIFFFNLLFFLFLKIFWTSNVFVELHEDCSQRVSQIYLWVYYFTITTYTSTEEIQFRYKYSSGFFFYIPKTVQKNRSNTVPVFFF